MRDLDKAYGPVQRAEWARENLLAATGTLKTALRELQKALVADQVAQQPNVLENDLVGHLDAVAAVWFDVQFEDAEDDPYAGMTNADVMSGEELAEYDRDAEYAQDAADEARDIAEAEAAAERYADDEFDGGPF